MDSNSAWQTVTMYGLWHKHFEKLLCVDVLPFCTASNSSNKVEVEAICEYRLSLEGTPWLVPNYNLALIAMKQCNNLSEHTFLHSPRSPFYEDQLEIVQVDMQINVMSKP